MNITHRLPWKMPYGYTQIVYEQGEPIDYDAAALEAMTMEQSYRQALGEDAYPERHEIERVADPEDNRVYPPQGQRGAPARAQAAKAPASGLLCPDHRGVALVESLAKYQTFDPGPDGQPLPAKFFCPGKNNGTGKNHAVWRSQAVPA